MLTNYHFQFSPFVLCILQKKVGAFCIMLQNFKKTKKPLDFYGNFVIIYIDGGLGIFSHKVIFCPYNQ